MTDGCVPVVAPGFLRAPRFWRLDASDFEELIALMDVALDDCGGMSDRLSVILVSMPDEVTVVAAASDVMAELIVEYVAAASPLGREVADAIGEPVSSTSCPLAAAPTAPTASRIRLYNPLNPFCTKSPASPLLSESGRPPGGGAKSLKVVKVSHWLAEVWILSRAWASCSLSTCEDVDWEAIESRRPRTLGAVEMLAGLIGTGLEDELLPLAAIVHVAQEVDTER